MNAVEINIEGSFYVTGGTLGHDALSYVRRRADDELYSGLTHGNFCYVLTSRQMGKSSLMVRTASSLRDEGVGVVVLDLTAIGLNLSAEQWYGGLLIQMAEQLCLEDELEEFWDSRANLGPLQRWMYAVRHIVLPRYPGRVVIFIDEIDAVRSLPFSTDEFFAAIREFYNRRTEDPELGRLTFCLLGVAAPSDLIRDTRVTPFNIGQRIELHDFSAEEARILVLGLGIGDERGKTLLDRILYWTSGHPYLTQRLCQASAEQKARSELEVDRLCEEFFFTRSARDKDDNLLFVRERLLRSEADRAELLSLYKEVRKGKTVEDDETKSCVTVLKLSGITRIQDGLLRARNRIYERVFDHAWVAQHMPDAEVRRQRAAYRRGLLRAAGIASIIILVVTALAFIAIGQRNLARDREETNRRQLYAAEMNLAARDWEDSSIEHMREMLDRQFPELGQADLRGFEWYLLWALAHPERETVNVEGEYIWIVFSPDLKMFASIEPDDVKIWEVKTGNQLRSLREVGMRGQAEFGPHGNLLATDSVDHSIRIWDLSSNREIYRLTGHTNEITEIRFSPDGKTLCASSDDGTARLWDLGTQRLLATLKEHRGRLNTINFSPDGRRLVTAGDDLMVRLWDSATGALLSTLKEHPATKRNLSSRSYINRIFFSPDGSRILACGRFLNIAVWNALTGEPLPALEGHRLYASGVAFSADRKLMATGSNDRTILVWDLNTWKPIKRLAGHSNRIVELAFSRDNRTLFSAAEDKTVKLWDVDAASNPVELSGAQLASYSRDGRTVVSADPTGLKVWDTSNWKEIENPSNSRSRISTMASSQEGRIIALATAAGGAMIWDLEESRERVTLEGFTSRVRFMSLSSDSKLLATTSDDRALRLWDTETGQEFATLEQSAVGFTDVVFSPDGTLLATGNPDTTVKLWDVRTRRVSAVLKGHLSATSRLCFSPDGKILASGSFDSTVKLWVVATRNELLTLKGHASTVTAIAFSPDGKRLATGGEDFTVRLWEVSTGEELASFRRHTGPIWRLEFSRDGKDLISSGLDGTARVWRASGAEEIKVAR